MNDITRVLANKRLWDKLLTFLWNDCPELTYEQRMSIVEKVIDIKA